MRYADMLGIGKCYHAPELVFKIEGIEYYAADAIGVRDFDGDIVFNLSGHSYIPSGDSVPNELSEYIVAPYKEVMIPWQDGGIPFVKSSFWRALHDYLKGNNFKSVCIHCEAGHGRTGTALASILVANLSWSMDKAIKYVREMVCRHMVETSEQCHYLVALDQEINGRESIEEDIPDPSINTMIEEYYIEKEKEQLEKEMPEYKHREAE